MPSETHIQHIVKLQRHQTIAAPKRKGIMRQQPYREAQRIPQKNAETKLT